MSITPDPDLLARAQAERERNRAEAHQALRLDGAPSPAETAALEMLAPDRWILHHADDYVDGTIRLLDQRGYLTTPELRAAERRTALDAHRVFGHVTNAEHRAAIDAHMEFIGTLRQAVRVLAEQLDAVGGLAPVQRSKAGETAAVEVARVREAVDGAYQAWITAPAPRVEDAA